MSALLRILFLCSLALLAGAGSLCAHEPFLLLTANADGTFTAETGFSDGASTEGMKLIVRDRNTGAALSQHEVPADGKLTLKAPAVPYRVIFEGGPGHRISKAGPELEPGARTGANAAAPVFSATPSTGSVAAGASPSAAPSATDRERTSPQASTPVAARPPTSASASVTNRSDTTRMVLIVGIFFLFGSVAFALGHAAGRRSR